MQRAPIQLPPGQQLVAADKWPVIGERAPSDLPERWSVSAAGLVERPTTWDLDTLTSLPQIERVIDIHCVTRWSKLGVVFGGVPLDELLARSEPLEFARYVSFVSHSDRGHSSSLPVEEAVRLNALVALRADGKPLSSEHGGPVRVVVPGRYFYKSVKWLARIELLADDRLGYWESTAGYHNEADPLREQRYVASRLTKKEVQRLLSLLNWSGRDLLGIALAGHTLLGLDATEARLRNADFRKTALRAARFDGANLSNADFGHAELREASFRGADLEGANLAGADLRGADFRGASLVAATFVESTGAEQEQEGPTQHAIAAQIDSTTQFDDAALEHLMPDQAAFVARSR